MVDVADAAGRRRQRRTTPHRGSRSADDRPDSRADRTRGRRPARRRSERPRARRTRDAAADELSPRLLPGPGRREARTTRRCASRAPCFPGGSSPRFGRGETCRTKSMRRFSSARSRAAACTSRRSIPKATLTLMREEIDRIQRELLDRDGLERLVQQFITEYFLRNETNGDQATFLARAQIYHGDYPLGESLRRRSPARAARRTFAVWRTRTCTTSDSSISAKLDALPRDSDRAVLSQARRIRSRPQRASSASRATAPARRLRRARDARTRAERSWSGAALRRAAGSSTHPRRPPTTRAPDALSRRRRRRPASGDRHAVEIVDEVPSRSMEAVRTQPRVITRRSRPLASTIKRTWERSRPSTQPIGSVSARGTEYDTTHAGVDPRFDLIRGVGAMTRRRSRVRRRARGSQPTPGRPSED